MCCGELRAHPGGERVRHLDVPVDLRVAAHDSRQQCEQRSVRRRRDSRRSRQVVVCGPQRDAEAQDGRVRGDLQRGTGAVMLLGAESHDVGPLRANEVRGTRRPDPVRHTARPRRSARRSQGSERTSD